MNPEFERARTDPGEAVNRWDVLFALICVNAAAVPIIPAIYAAKWVSTSCGTPVWITGAIMFLAGATVALGTSRVFKIIYRRIKK